MSGGEPRSHAASRFFKEDEVGLGRAFEISTVNRHDAGTYTCLATNALGESMAKDVAIDVQCKSCML